MGLDVFGVEPDVPFAEPGNVPHGDPLGVVPGVFVVLGLTVEGCVVPGVAGLGELDPGALVFGVPLGEIDPGVVCPGVVGVVVWPGLVCDAVPVGGFTLPVGGVAVEPGAELCPALLDPPAGAAPPGAAWAIAQLAQHNTTAINVSFRDDISRPPSDLDYSSFQGRQSLTTILE